MRNGDFMAASSIIICLFTAPANETAKNHLLKANPVTQFTYVDAYKRFDHPSAMYPTVDSVRVFCLHKLRHLLQWLRREMPVDKRPCFFKLHMKHNDLQFGDSEKNLQTRYCRVEIIRQHLCSVEDITDEHAVDIGKTQKAALEKWQSIMPRQGILLLFGLC